MKTIMLTLTVAEACALSYAAATNAPSHSAAEFIWHQQRDAAQRAREKLDDKLRQVYFVETFFTPPKTPAIPPACPHCGQKAEITERAWCTCWDCCGSGQDDSGSCRTCGGSGKIYGKKW